MEQELANLVTRLAGRLDSIADEMVGAYVDQIPEYRSLSATVLDDVQRISAHNLEVWLRVVGEERSATPDEMAVFTSSARDRARAGVPLESLLHAYRLGGAVAWQATLRLLDGAPSAALAAGLELAGWLMRYVDEVSTAVAQSYLDERELLVTAEERHHRRVADLLLSEGPTSAETEARARAGGFQLATRYWVAHVSVCCHEDVRVVTHRLRSAALQRSPIAVPGERDILLLWPADSDPDLAHLDEAWVRLQDASGRPVLLAVAGPAGDELAAAHQEATVVAGLARGRTGLVRLEDVALDALVHQVAGRTADVVRERIRPLLDYERTPDGELSATLEVFLDCGGSVVDAAERLHVHRNTVAYRLGRIRELTGLDPQQPKDTFLLYAAMQLSRQDPD